MTQHKVFLLVFLVLPVRAAALAAERSVVTIERGVAVKMRDGVVLRARYRNSPVKPEFMNQREVYKFTLDLWAASNVFHAGHRVRLEVSSSNFPRLDRNLNTGEIGGAARLTKATNTIYHDREHPSALVLPVVPR